jgi:membrane protease YdiL (CAAX protease family)
VRHAVALAVTLALLVATVTYVPRRTVARVEWLRAALERDPRARLGFYRRFAVSAVLVVAFVAVVVAIGGAGADGLGMTWPAYASRRVFPVTVMALGAFFVTMVFVAAFTGRLRENARDPLATTRVLLPVSRAERRFWPVVAVAAGVSEELVYRGLFVLHLNALAPSLRLWPLVAVSALAFGLAHSYQGWYGVVGTGLLGVVFGTVAVATGSVLAAVGLHALWDVLVPFAAKPPPADT